MPVTAWATAGTVVTTGWTVTSGTAVNALAVAGGETIYDSTPPVTTQIIASNFGFSIPAGAVLEGIEVEVQAAYYDGAIVSGTVKSSVQITKNAADPYNDEKSFIPDAAYPSLPSGWITRTLGGAADLWGGPLLDTEVGAAGFGFLLGVASDSSELPNLGRAFSYLRARAHYSEATSPPPEILVGCDDNGRYVPGLSFNGTSGSIRN